MIRDVDVSGLTLVSVVHIPGNVLAEVADAFGTRAEQVYGPSAGASADAAFSAVGLPPD